MDAPTRPSRVVLLASYFSGGFGLAISAQVTFLMPLRAHELGADFSAIGLIAGVGSFGPAFLAVSLGALIDRLGPKNSFILGTAATAALSTLFVVVTSYWWFLILQPFLGLVQTFGWVASQTYITSLGAPAERPKFTGRFGFFVNVGVMCGPLLAGAATQLVGLRLAFLLPAAYSLLFAGVGLLLVETRGEVGRRNPRPQGSGVRAALELLRVRGMQFALVLTFARLWIGRVFAIFVPVFLVDKGLSAGLAGTVAAVSGLTAAVVAPTTGHWTRIASAETVALAGLGCGALALLLTPHLAFVPLVYVIPLLVGIGSGLSLPVLLSIVTGSAPSERRGVALGLRTTGNQAASTIAPVVVGPLITSLGMVLGFTAGGLICAVLLLGARWLHTGERRLAVEMSARTAAPDQPA